MSSFDSVGVSVAELAQGKIFVVIVFIYFIFYNACSQTVHFPFVYYFV